MQYNYEKITLITTGFSIVTCAGRAWEIYSQCMDDVGLCTAECYNIAK